MSGGLWIRGSSAAIQLLGYYISMRQTKKIRMRKNKRTRNRIRRQRGAGGFMSKAAVAATAVLFSDFVKERNEKCSGIDNDCLPTFAKDWLSAHPTFIPATYTEYSAFTVNLASDDIKRIPFPEDPIENFRVRLEYDPLKLYSEVASVGLAILPIALFIKEASGMMARLSTLTRVDLVFYKPLNKLEEGIKEYLLQQYGLGSKRTLPKNTANIIMAENIKVGDKMVNFKRSNKTLESNHNAYYKQNTYNSLAEEEDDEEMDEEGNPIAYKVNPFTRNPIKNVFPYTVKSLNKI